MNINELMKQAKKAQAEMDRAKKELAKKEFKVSKQGLEIVIAGDGEIKSIKIDDILMDVDDKELLEDILVIAINEGLDEVKKAESDLMPQGKV